MSNVFTYQILTHYMTRKDLDPACRVLDNSANERPDWYEYWPIRKFFMTAKLEEDAYYAFLSPRFKEKTNLRVSAAIEFVNTKANKADVVLFSPGLHLTAYHWNVFKYGETCHPGLLSTAMEFFDRIAQPTDLEELVTHSQNEVYSNYFFAKPTFWREWLVILDKLFSLAESSDDPLGVRLRLPTEYRGQVNAHMKIFIMERVPTWMLARNTNFKVSVRDPFAIRSRLYKLPGAMVCDALKLAYVSNGRSPRYKDMFRVFSKLGRPISLLIRLGYFLRFPSIRQCLDRLGTYWARAGRS